VLQTGCAKFVYERFTANATGLDPVDEANMKLIQTTMIMPL